MKVYIAGKVRGLENYREVFKEEEQYLKSKGCVVLNPAELPEGMNGEDYMRICIPMLEVADAIYLLSNWEDSEGEKVEKAYAECQKKEIVFQSKDNDFNVWKTYNMSDKSYYDYVKETWKTMDKLDENKNLSIGDKKRYYERVYRYCKDSLDELFRKGR